MVNVQEGPRLARILSIKSAKRMYLFILSINSAKRKYLKSQNNVETKNKNTESQRFHGLIIFHKYEKKNRMSKEE